MDDVTTPITVSKTDCLGEGENCHCSKCTVSFEHHDGKFAVVKREKQFAQSCQINTQGTVSVLNHCRN